MKNQKGISSSLAMIIVIVLAGFVIGGVLAFRYWWTPEEEIPEEALTDETADWEVYTTSDPRGWDFSVKYPKDWEFEYETGGGVFFRKSFEDNSGKTYSCNIFLYPLWNPDLDCKKLLSYHYKNTYVKYEIVETDLNIGGKLTYKVLKDEESKWEKIDELYGPWYIFAANSEESYCFEASLSIEYSEASTEKGIPSGNLECDNIFSQTLSTFMFID